MPDQDLQQELVHLKDALALLGARPCVHCGKFFLTADASNLFHSGSERVCYNCIAPWWHDRCPTLPIPERQSIEPKLMRWLIEYHQAKIFRNLNDLPPQEKQDIHLTLGCRMRRHRHPRRRPLPPLRRQPQCLGHHLQKTLRRIMRVPVTPTK